MALELTPELRCCWRNFLVTRNDQWTAESAPRFAQSNSQLNPTTFLGHGYVSKRSQKMGTPESYAAYALENNWCGKPNHKNHPPIELYDWVGIGMI